MKAIIPILLLVSVVACGFTFARDVDQSTLSSPEWSSADAFDTPVMRHLSDRYAVSLAAPNGNGNGNEGNGNSGNPNSGSGNNNGKGKGKRQDRSKDGDYSAIAAGYYGGRGIAKVSTDKVSLHIDVVARDGTSAKLVVNNMRLTGPYFCGTGNLAGKSVEVSGKLDAPRASRFTATFFVDDGHSGRIVAMLPSSVDAGDENWDKVKD